MCGYTKFGYIWEWSKKKTSPKSFPKYARFCNRIRVPGEWQNANLQTHIWDFFEIAKKTGTIGKVSLTNTPHFRNFWYAFCGAIKHICATSKHCISTLTPIIGVFLLKFSLQGVPFFPKFQIHQFQLNLTKFDQIRPNFTRKSRSHIYNTARESQYKNFSKRPNSSHMPFTPTHHWHPAWTLFEWNPCKDLYTWASELPTRNWVFGNWVFWWYFSNNWGVSSEIFTPGGAFF